MSDKEYLLSKNTFSFSDLCLLVKILRSKDGCPWDREQTAKSVRNCFIDETYEFIEGLDNDDNALMCEELGDVLFQVVFHSQIKTEEEKFNVNDVIDGICKKMILRHPHVFANVSVTGSEQVLSNWDIIKNDEKQRKTPYAQLDAVSKSLPSLMRAQKLISKAEKNDLLKQESVDDCIKKIEEITEQIKNKMDGSKIGELLFAVASLSRLFDVEAEEALYVENERFLEKYKEK